MYQPSFISLCMWCLNRRSTVWIQHWFRHYIHSNSDCDASCPGGGQSAIFVRTVWWTSAFRPVWPAGRRAVLCRLWKGLRYQRRSEVLIDTQSYLKHFFHSLPFLPRSCDVLCMKSWDDIVLFSPERPDCVAGRLCFVFYSSLKNLKEVYITPAQGQKVPIRGQVR